jgi:hypothetical protein
VVELLHGEHALHDTYWLRYDIESQRATGLLPPFATPLRMWLKERVWLKEMEAGARFERHDRVSLMPESWRRRRGP